MSDKTGGLIMFLIEIVFLLLVIAAAILLVQGTRKFLFSMLRKLLVISNMEVHVNIFH